MKECATMDQLQRVQHLLSCKNHTFAVSDIEDIAAVCDVEYGLVDVIVHLARLQNQNVHAEIIKFIKEHCPDITADLPEYTSASDT